MYVRTYPKFFPSSPQHLNDNVNAPIGFYSINTIFLWLWLIFCVNFPWFWLIICYPDPGGRKENDPRKTGSYLTLFVGRLEQEHASAGATAAGSWPVRDRDCAPEVPLQGGQGYICFKNINSLKIFPCGWPRFFPGGGGIK